MDNITESQTNLKTLTEGIHSKEALELVREHVLGVMGPASMAYSNTMIKMSKLQVCHTAVPLTPCLSAPAAASLFCRFLMSAAAMLNNTYHSIA